MENHAAGVSARRMVAVMKQLSEPARAAAKAACEHARRLGHDTVGSEHLLLGLLDDPAGAPAVVLERLGVAGSVLDAVLARRPSTLALVPADVPFADDAELALQSARAEAQRAGRQLAEPEHLLLGVAAVPGGGADTLAAVGVDALQVRMAVAALTSQEPTAAAAEASGQDAWLALAERFVVAAERIADALESPERP